MLTLSRRTNESITIGDDVEVVVLSVSRGRVRLGIRAPRSIAVHRTELVASIEKENQRAMAQQQPLLPDVSPDLPNLGASEESVIVFPKGLLGLAPHDRFLLCETGEQSQLRALVSVDDPAVQLLVVDAVEVWPDFPVDNAKRLSGLAEQEVAVAAVCTVPGDGSTATVNLKAPIVIGLESRVALQVILDREELGMHHELSVSAPENGGGTQEPAHASDAGTPPAAVVAGAPGEPAPAAAENLP